MLQIGDIVMMEEDKQEGEIYGYVTEFIYGYVTEFDDEIGLVAVSWFDGQRSKEFPNHIIKVENG